MKSSSIFFLIILILLWGCRPKEYVVGAKAVLPLNKGKPFVYILNSNLGTGYRWVLADTVNFRILSMQILSNPNTDVSTEIEKFEIIPLQEGSHELKFYSLRPFEKQTDTSNIPKISQKTFTK